MIMHYSHTRKHQDGQQAIEYLLLLIAVVLVIIAFVGSTHFKKTVNDVLDMPSALVDKSK